MFSTYQEKELHRTLKNRFCPDSQFQEVAVGTYVADICKDGTIIEVQTGNLLPLREKIGWYLEQTDYEITVVHPVIEKRRVVCLSKEGEVVKNYRSPRHESLWDGLGEISKLEAFVQNPRLHFLLLFVDVTEYRQENGFKRGKVRYGKRETVLNEVLSERAFHGASDYVEFLPQTEEPFTAREYEKLVGVKNIWGYPVVYLLSALGLVAPTEKKGRAKAWKIVK